MTQLTEHARAVEARLCDWSDMATPIEAADTIAALCTALEAAQADAARLDYLDGNLRFKMGWNIGAAPAGNLSVTSVIFLGKPPVTIRQAIDAAIAAQEKT